MERTLPNGAVAVKTLENGELIDGRVIMVSLIAVILDG